MFNIPPRSGDVCGPRTTVAAWRTTTLTFRSLLLWFGVSSVRPCAWIQPVRPKTFHHYIRPPQSQS